METETSVVSIPSVPSDPRKLGLKYSKWRDSQPEIIDKVLHSKKRFFFVDAPTGSGKSGVAIGLGKLLPKKTIILTHSIQLAGQYLHDCKDLETLHGRRNYPCYLNNEYKANDAPCTAGFMCQAKDKCQYHVAKRKAFYSDRPLITNYSYFLTLSEHTPIPTELLVCDEGHFAEGELMKHIQIRLDRQSFKDLRIRLPQKFVSMEHASEWATQILPAMIKEMEEITDVMQNIVGDPFLQQALVIRFGMLRDSVSSVHKLANIDKHNVWLIGNYNRSIILRPVWIHQLSDLLFAGAKKVLIQSATLIPELVSGLLSIPKDDYESMSLPSDFPRDRRPLYHWPVAKMGIRSPQEEMDKLLAAVDTLIDEYGDKKGIVHTVNYATTEFIVKNSKHRKRFIAHETSNRAEQIDKFLNTEKTWLVSPSVMTGLDAPFDKCEAQIICKCPFEDQGDEQVKRRMEEDPTWYDLNTVFMTAQAYGRAMRDKWDYGETWILDKHFGWFYKKNFYNFPAWFREAVETVEKPLRRNK